MCGFGQASAGFGASTLNTNNVNTNSAPCGLFGQSHQQPPNVSLFGNNKNHQQQSSSAFGTNNNVNNPSSGSLFGQTQTAGGLFGNNQSNNVSSTSFAQYPQNRGGAGLFGNSNVNNGACNLFGQPSQTHTSGGLFGNNQPNNTTNSLFGQPSANQGATGLFGNTNTNQQQRPGSLFGSNVNATGGGLFGSTPQSQTNGLGTSFSQNPNPSAGLFGRQQNGPGLFGNVNTTPSPSSGNTGAQAGGPFNNSQLTANGFANASHGGATQSCFPATYMQQPPALGTRYVPSEAERTAETPNGVDIYQHISFTPTYNRQSAEELRLIDYDIGQIRPPFAEPSVVSPFTSRKTEHDAASGSPAFSFGADTTTDVHAHCNARLTSKDAEIRLLNAKVIILEDRLQRANDTPQFGKSGLERYSLFSPSPTPEGPRKGDPSVPINPDPSTNNTGLNFTDVNTKLQPKAWKKPTMSFPPDTQYDLETPSMKTHSQTAKLPATSSGKVSNEIILANSSTALTENIRRDDVEKQFESQTKRMNNIESQLQKLTALLEKQVSSSYNTPNDAATPIENPSTIEKGKGRVEKDEVESGASTPAVIIYTPGSSTAGFSDDEVAVTWPLNDTEKNIESGGKIGSEVKEAKEGGLSLNAINVLHLMEEDQMHITSVAKACKLTIREASAAIEQLLEEKYVTAIDDQDNYILTR